MDFLLTHTMLERESFTDAEQMMMRWRQMTVREKMIVGLRVMLVAALGTVAARMALSCNSGSPMRFVYAVVSFISPTAAIPYYALVVGSRCAAFWV